MTEPGSRERLLAAALEHTSTAGYTGASVASICHTAGVTKPTLYHFFANKEGLFAALVATHGPQLTQRLTLAARYDGDIKRALERIAAEQFAVSREHEAFSRTLVLAWFGPREAATRPALELLAAWYQLLVETFTAAERDHGNMRGRARRYAVSFGGLLFTYQNWGWAELVDTSDPALPREVVHQFMHGIFS